MRGFFNWSFRYTRNKFYKILFFFILFLVFSFFVSSCKVHASALPSTESLIYSQTQNCEVDSSTPGNITCSKGTSYKFLFNTNKTDNNTTYITPMILNTTEHNILVQNMVYDIKLDQTYTIGSDEYIYLNFKLSDTSFFKTYSTSYFSLNMFPNDSLDQQNNLDRRATFPINFSFKPYFCSYYDTTANELKTCDMFYRTTVENNLVYLSWALNLSEGTSLNRFIVYFGTNELFSGTAQTKTSNSSYLPSFKVPYINNLYIDGNWNNITANNLAQYYGTTYNDYADKLGSSYSSTYPIGPLWWYPKGILLSQPEFTLPDTDNFVSKGSILTTNRKNRKFTELYTIEQQTILNGGIVDLEEEFNEQQGVSDTWFEDSLDGFTNSDQSNSFINIFNALITKPFQKLNESVNEDLFSDHASNSEGTGGLNLALCTGRNIVGGIPEGRLQIPIFHGVSWDFPCLHYDTYSKLRSTNVNFAFYPSTVDGHSIQSGSQYNLYSIIRLILRGFLVFCLYKSCLDIYHYILDSDRKEIEVLDL